MNSHNTKKTLNGQSIERQKGLIILFWKYPGETLAVMLRRFCEEHNTSEYEKITYAGRLDPMAEGIVPLLVGEARFQKDYLIGRSKTYEVDIILGLSTDTGDLLGLVTKNSISARKVLAESDIEKALQALSELQELPYPNYSSRPVEGKPLFMHARAGKQVKLPTKKVIIHAIELLDLKEVSLCALLGNAQKTIAKVQGDFRQAEIMEQWASFAKATGDRTKKDETVVQVISIRTTVSSGTYMRSLAEKLGELLGVPALAGWIVRTNIHGIE